MGKIARTLSRPNPQRERAPGERTRTPFVAPPRHGRETRSSEPREKSMLAHASRVTQKRSVQKGSLARVGEKTNRRAGVSRVVSVRPARPEARRRHGARKVETKALLPMAGTSAALAVALQATKTVKPPALLASAVLAAVASLLVSKGLNSENEDRSEEQNQQWDAPTASGNA